MHYYRISKYDPKYRKNGVYCADEWTSIADVGKEFGGAALTIEEYESAEENYLRFLRKMFQMCGEETFEIQELEKYSDQLPWENGMLIDQDGAERICREMLRENCWCRLKAKWIQIDFGYDYYLHLACELPIDMVKKAAKEFELFVERWHE